MATDILGINWLRYHPDNKVDMRHITKMQYRIFLLYEWMWSDKDFCQALVAAAPQDAIFIARDHPLSEQKSGLQGGASGLGTYHANEWATKVAEGKVHLPLSRTWFEGLNEPDTNPDWAPAAIDAYTREFVTELGEQGLKACGWVFGPGHPSTPLDPTTGMRKPSGPPDWAPFKASATALRKYDGLADFHAYGSHDDFPWDDHLARMQTCPYELNCVITEFGIDEGIKGNAQVGYKGNLQPDVYVHWLDHALQGVRGRLLRSRLNLKGVAIFAYDTNSDWKLFDISDCRDALERKHWTAVEPVPFPQPGQPSVTVLPYVFGPGGSAPQPQPDSENFSRALQWVLGREGGFSSDPNDIGNYDAEGNFIGTKYGISGRVWGKQFDIANLTKEQAATIYRMHYWDAMGCGNRAWPIALLLFDSAVQHGVGTARQLERDAGTNDDGWTLRFLAARLQYYANAKTWHYHGQAWVLRVSSLMREMVG